MSRQEMTLTPDEQAQLARQKQIARTPEIRVEHREPLDGQRSLFDRPKPRKKTEGKQPRKED